MRYVIQTRKMVLSNVGDPYYDARVVDMDTGSTLWVEFGFPTKSRAINSAQSFIDSLEPEWETYIPTTES